MNQNYIDCIIKKAEDITKLITYLYDFLDNIPENIKDMNQVYTTPCGLMLNHSSFSGIRCSLPYEDRASFYLNEGSGYMVGDCKRIRFSTGYNSFSYFPRMGSGTYITHEYIDNFSEEYIFQLLTVEDARSVESIILMSALNKNCQSFFGDLDDILYIYERVKDKL